MSLRAVMLATTIVAAPVAAMAQPVTGLYVGLGAGGNFLQDEHLQASPGIGSPSGKLQFNWGAAGVGSVGYGLGNGLRFEVEGDYRYNQLLHVNRGYGNAQASGGSQEDYGAMVNALYDIDLSRFGVTWMTPYVGVGAGYQWTRWNALHGTNINTGRVVGASDTSGNFAYQGIVGTAFPFHAVPGLALTLEYRFMGVLGNQSFRGAGFRGATPVSTGNLDISENLNHAVLFGVRYAFGAAPPPPPPAQPAPVAAPAPAPTRTYLVFFDWDRADLTDRARQIIQEAAQASTRVQYTRIEVNGYTDLSGTPQYNQGLSVRRAQSVAAELVRDGVPRQAISIQGFGETHPLVPTAQGVREPQNRRVEIILR